MGLKNASREHRNEETENLRIEDIEEYSTKVETRIIHKTSDYRAERQIQKWQLIACKNFSGEYFHQRKVVVIKNLKEKNAFVIYLSRCSDL